ncbi:MAG: penicillin-binding protein 1C [Acidobacteria bacterium]|nr:penicillin-binding protein 1C [Acidobacteriota bacterium]MBV9478426.1 penicillin-binding protein 1C [Acidobacteriota bacterium]
MKWKWLGGAGAAVVALALYVRLGPLAPIDANQFESLTVVDRHGEVLYEPLASTGNRALWLKADELPQPVIDATLAAEDRRFFSHVGVDPLAIARAVVHDVRALRVVEGGSTISQQAAKLLLGSRERTLTQKLRESVVALRLEHRYSKREILALYLNLAPYGNRINGIARASRAYFGCPPQNLTPAQAAFLAALPQRPDAFNPLRNPRAARTRQLAVLARMPLSRDDLAHARDERLRFATSAQPAVAMHYVEHVLAHAPSRGRITTSLDAGLQRDVLGIIAAHRDDLVRHGARSVAVVVFDNRSGQWLAWEGSGDYFGSSFGGAIDGVTTPRQPGSTLKPFTYALAFESGESPATVLADVPSHFPTAEEGIVYTPRNYDGRYRGPLRVRAALAGSENIPAVAMLAKLGPESLLRLLRNAGFTTFDRTADYYGLGLTLGDAEVTLEQLVRAYSVFARDGVAANGRRVVAPRTAFWITDILSDPDARAYAFGTGGSLDFPFPVAVKTGTSQAYRDNWTVGYTRDVTVGVWVGNFDRTQLRGSSGITGAAPIFHGVMLAAMQRARGRLPIGDTTPVVAPPANVTSVEICALSGLRPSPYCPAVRKEWLPSEQPARFCAWHHADGAIDWPGEYRAWNRAAQPALAARGETVHRAETLRIANPPDGATYLIDPTLRAPFQSLRLRAIATSRVAWQVDGRRVASTEWPLVPGRHEITAVDAEGRSDRVRIFVK